MVGFITFVFGRITINFVGYQTWQSRKVMDGGIKGNPSQDNDSGGCHQCCKMRGGYSLEPPEVSVKGKENSPND